MSPSSIRAAVVSDKVETVERMLAGVRTLPLESESAFLADPRMVAAGESFLRRGLEALFDLGRHLLAKAFGDPTSEYKEIARRLGEHGVLHAEHVERFVSMAGYRNRLVHFYDEVSPAELYEILTIHLDDLRTILDELLRWLERHPDLVDSSL